jgi:hypothetical protein
MTLTKALGGSGGSTITTKDEGSTLSSTVTTLDFVGAGVTASGAGATTTVTIPSNGTNPDTLPATANAADDEFDGGALDTAGTRFSGATAWAWRNQGGATWTQDSGYGILTGVGQTGSNLRIVEQVVGAGPWKYRCLLRSVKVASASNFSLAGMCVVNNGSGKVLGIYKGYNGGVAIAADKWTNVTTYSTALFAAVDLNAAHIRHSMSDPIWLEIETSGTNLIFRYSIDGVVWSTGATEALATFISSVDRIGLIAHNDTNSNQPIGVYGWWRRVA